MKYTVEGFSQEKLVEHGLDCRDAVFLRWFVDFQATGQMKIHVAGSRVYHWIDHATVIKELPILGRTTPDSVGKYIKQLIEKGVLEKHLVRRGQDKGTEVYYRIVPALIYECITNEEEHPHDHASTTPAQTGGSDSSAMILQQKEGNVADSVASPSPVVREQKANPPSSFPELQKRMSTEAISRRGTPPRWTGEFRDMIRAVSVRYGPTAVIEAWCSYLEAGGKLNIGFFLEDTNIADYSKPVAEEQVRECPSCGRRVKPWEASETDCIHCMVVANTEQAAQSFDEIRNRFGQMERISA